MNEITRIREALAATLAPLGQVVAYPGPAEYDRGKGFTRRQFICRVFADSERRLDDLLADDGDASVKAALERDPTLGGAVEHMTVVKSSGYQRYRPGDGDPEQLGAEWTVETLTE